MPTLENENSMREQLEINLKELLSNSPESLVQEERLGSELCFKEGLPYFKRAFSLFTMLGSIDINRLPYTSLSLINDQIKSILDLIKNINSFKATDNAPITIRNQYIDLFRDSYDTWFQHISPIIAFCIREGTDFQLLQNKARDMLVQIENIQKDSTEKSALLINDTEATLEKVRRAAAEVGVSQHATHFQQQATIYSDEAKIWLIAVIVVGVLTGIWGFFAFYCMSIPENELATHYTVFIQLIMARGSVLLLLFMSLIWCAKNYAVARHNFIINKHRQNSLSTFETFVKAAGDDEQTKNAVLLQATQSIFSAQPTGLITKNSETESSGKIIEIVKHLSK